MANWKNYSSSAIHQQGNQGQKNVPYWSYDRQKSIPNWVIWPTGFYEEPGRDILLTLVSKFFWVSISFHLCRNVSPAAWNFFLKKPLFFFTEGREPNWELSPSSHMQKCWHSCNGCAFVTHICSKFSWLNSVLGVKYSTWKYVWNKWQSFWQSPITVSAILPILAIANLRVLYDRLSPISYPILYLLLCSFLCNGKFSVCIPHVKKPSTI